MRRDEEGGGGEGGDWGILTEEEEGGSGKLVNWWGQVEVKWRFERGWEEMKKGDGEGGELGNFGRANIKSPAGAASQLLRIPADFDQTQDQR